MNKDPDGLMLHLYLNSCRDASEMPASFEDKKSAVEYVAIGSDLGDRRNPVCVLDASAT